MVKFHDLHNKPLYSCMANKTEFEHYTKSLSLFPHIAHETALQFSC